ncbi:macrolide family glycosyltransferase [Ktedonobacter racemifer]|uniref:Glycosyltransferase, MGT family n=1 Tax=Ktedonobacter racemifer DSM 44963 TaxID=485913 RepID=D6TUM1_KTERA|nr:macrolide family glycosyltransferase [Ktedonobacter racemifer]EFH84089.1 glycosyltransferase, MGT family [Ktedonobacter racemifer DSM 44963]
MKKYIFLNVPATGHVNPTLPIVQELIQRGEQVIYYLTEEFRAAIEATGAIFRPYESFLEGIGPGPMPLKMAEESRRVLPQVLESIRAEQPDALLYEAMCLWGRIVAQVLQVETIVLRASYAANEHFGLFTARSDASMPFPSELLERFQVSSAELSATYHLPPFDLRQFVAHAEGLNVVFLPRAFQPAGETFDERFVFVGPSLLPRQDAPAFPWERLGDQPVLYISLGTAFNHRPDFFRLCFQAFGELPSQVVLSHGKRLDPAVLGPAPANFLLAPSVPQLEMLQRTSVFVTHGGMNSIMESLYFGVPLVVIPQMMEQEITARRVEELELGAALTQENATAEHLREAVARVQQDPSITQYVQAMQQQVRAAGGYQRATDAILDFAYKRASLTHSRSMEA